MDAEFEAIKATLIADETLRKEFLSRMPAKDVAMILNDIPGGASISILSPAHSSNAAYFSPVLRLPADMVLDVLGHFECVSDAGLVPLPIQGIEDGRRAGSSDKAVQVVELPLRNEQQASVLLALRLCLVADLPHRFLLFSPTFRSGSGEFTPSPVLLSFVEGRGLCLFS